MSRPAARLTFSATLRRRSTPHTSGVVTATRSVARIGLCVVLLIGVWAAGADADSIVVFSNLGPGDGFDVGTTESPWIPIASDPFFVGFAFTPTQDVILHDVTVAVSSRRQPGQTAADAVALAIRNTGPEGRPDQDVLETLHVNGLPPALRPFSPLTATSHSGLTLFAGTTYWLTATTLGGLAMWNFNSVGDVGMTYVQDASESELARAQTGAFRVTGTAVQAPVPEPTSFMLLSFGSLASIFRRRCHVASK